MLPVLSYVLIFYCRILLILMIALLLFWIYIFCIIFALHFKQYGNIFFSGLCLIYAKRRTNIAASIFLLGFCFKNVDLLETKLAHFYACLFTCLTLFGPISLSNNACFIMMAIRSRQHPLKPFFY